MTKRATISNHAGGIAITAAWLIADSLTGIAFTFAWLAIAAGLALSLKSDAE